MSNILLRYARLYLQKGFSVAPLRPKSKIPAVAWKEFQYRKPTDKEIEAWFLRRGRGIGGLCVVTGDISGICVLDCDSTEAYAYAKTKGLIEAPTVKTSRGFHVYFRHREGIGSTQFLGGFPGMEIKSDGCIVALPPSIHPSGCQYRWVTGKSLEDLPLREAPEWISEELERPSSHSCRVPLRELYEVATEGERNSSLARVAGSLVRDGLTLEECTDLLLAVNERYDPPLEEEEVEGIASSIFKIHHERKAPIRDVPTSKKCRMTPEEKSAKLAERLRDIQPIWERVKPIYADSIQR